VILFEDNYRRGRAPGEIIGLFRRGLATADRASEVQEAHSWRKAVELALKDLSPGELLVVQADEVDDTVAYLKRRLTDDPNIREIDIDNAARLPSRQSAVNV
jgi:cyanophycin synthetase